MGFDEDWEEERKKQQEELIKEKYWFERESVEDMETGNDSPLDREDIKKIMEKREKQ